MFLQNTSLENTTLSGYFKGFGSIILFFFIGALFAGALLQYTGNIDPINLQIKNSVISFCLIHIQFIVPSIGLLLVIPYIFKIPFRSVVLPSNRNTISFKRVFSFLLFWLLIGGSLEFVLPLFFEEETSVLKYIGTRESIYLAIIAIPLTVIQTGFEEIFFSRTSSTNALSKNKIFSAKRNNIFFFVYGSTWSKQRNFELRSFSNAFILLFGRTFFLRHNLLYK